MADARSVGTEGHDDLTVRTLSEERRTESAGDESGFGPAVRVSGADNIDLGSARRANIALIGVIAAFIVLGTVIAIKTPAYESADEPAHVQNIETLLTGNWYGMNANCKWTPFGPVDCSGLEAHQAPLYYLVFAGWQRLVGVPAHAPYKGDAHPYPSSTGLFLHHSPADLRFLLWLRLPNVFLGALTVLFTFFAVRLISRDPWTPVVAASIVAFLPRFIFLSSFVTNDNLVNLLGAILTFAALKYARAPSRWRIAAVGSVFGLLVTTKLSTLPVALVLVALACMGQGWKQRAEFLGVGAGTALAFCGWYLIQNTVRYGDPLAVRASARYLAQVGGLGAPFLQPYKAGNPLTLVFVKVPERIEIDFWYTSGWNQFHWSWPVNLMFWLVLAGALAGLVHRHVDRRMLIALLAIATTAFLSVWSVAFQTATYQGRYALVGVAAIAALASLGLERWKLAVRFLLPTMGLCGTLIAIQQNVLAIHWGT